MSRTVLSATCTMSFNPPNSLVRKVILMFSFINEDNEPQSLVSNSVLQVRPKINPNGISEGLREGLDKITLKIF